MDNLPVEYIISVMYVCFMYVCMYVCMFVELKTKQVKFREELLNN
jgi:hypothetical protein